MSHKGTVYVPRNQVGAPISILGMVDFVTDQQRINEGQLTDVQALLLFSSYIDDLAR